MTKKRIISLLIMLSVLLSLFPLMAFSAQSDSTLDWPQFLGNKYMPGVADAKTPTSSSNLVEKWRVRDGEGWNATPGTPIVVGDYVYCYINQYIRKFNLETGEELAKSQVYGASTNQFFIYTTYAEGKLFVPCQTNSLDSETTGVKGCHIRVYDADTLEPLYITESIAGSGMQTPITYHDGYIFVGTYFNGFYACFDTKDEDPDRTDEVKTAKWKIQAPSEARFGFNWSGAAFIKNSCIFTDAGFNRETNPSSIYVVDYKTGEFMQDTIKLPDGYKSTACVIYYEKNNRIYISCNCPSGCAAILSYEINDDGTIDIDSKLEYQSGVTGGGTQSTPIIYNDRIYLGGGGGTMGTNEPFHVIDANTLEEIYAVPGLLTKGSAAITTAYATEENNNLVYIYVVPYAPKDGESQLWILKDSEGQTEPDYEVISGIGASQYCSQTMDIADNGSLVWYNDAGYVYCYGNTEDTTITAEDVEKQIQRLPELEDFEYYNAFEVSRIKERYNQLSTDEQAKVKLYDKLQSILQVASIDPLTRLNQGIASLPALDQLTLDEHQSKVKAMYKAYNKLTEEEQGQISESEKLANAYEQILVLVDKAAVESVIDKINALPDVDSLTSADGAAVNSALASLNNLGEDLRGQVTNIAKLEESLERIDSIKKQMDKVKAFIMDNLSGVTMTLDNKALIDQVDEMMAGLAQSDIYSMTEYEQYVSPAKVDIINLMLKEYIIENGKGIQISKENVDQLSNIIMEIKGYFNGVMDNDKRYIEGYDILLSVEEDLETFIQTGDETEKPGEPDKPNDGIDNSKPDDENNEGKITGKDKEENVKTGDSGILPFLLVAGISGLLLIFLITILKKRKDLNY